MLNRAGRHGIHHVLAQHTWARQRLAAHAGRVIEFRLPPLPDLRLIITPEGQVAEAGAETASDLTVNIKPSALPWLLLRDEAVMREVEITGSAELAQVLQQLFRELEWDFEEDLSRVFGDIAAHRMAGAARDLMAWQRTAGLRLAQNFADYWTEEAPLIARREDVAQFGREVERMRDDTERLEKRIEKLQRATPG